MISATLAVVDLTQSKLAPLLLSDAGGGGSRGGPPGNALFYVAGDGAMMAVSVDVSVILDWFEELREQVPISDSGSL